MERLIELSRLAATRVPMQFARYLTGHIDWGQKMVGISGARGSGKTIMLLQQMKKLLKQGKSTLYASLDDIYFAENKLIYFAEEFLRNGGEYLFLDEVHKYPNWSQELKNIYDSLPGLNVVFTGSSALEIYRGSHDLSRRALVYQLAGLSFREFLLFKHNMDLPVLTLREVTANKIDIVENIISQTKILPLFNDYLKEGYYPFFKESKKNYLRMLSNTINLVVENDLPIIHKIDFNSIIKLKKLIAVISRITPFTPNIEKLATQVETTRPTLLKYLYYLDRAKILRIITKSNFGINYLNKPDKIYLDNTNLAYAFADTEADKGTVRETFFLNQLSVAHKVTLPGKGDFLVDNKYLFEVGGRNKTRKQIAGLANAYVAADDIEIGYEDKIPLWLFGFLY